MALSSPSSSNWLRPASYLIIGVWALFGAASCVAVYDASAIGIGPAPMWAATWTTTMESAPWLIAPILACPALAAAVGWRYLRDRGVAGRRWRAAWFSTALVGLLIEPMLIWSANGYQFVQAGSRAPHPLWLLTGFLVAGSAMIAMLVLAARQPAQAPLAR